MVIAYHAIFTAYGFWLPNDPRGSWSDFVRSWELRRFGPATKTDQRRSLAREKHDVQQRLAAKDALQYPPVRFTGQQALACIRGFASAVEKSGYVGYACSILPEHVHMVICRHRYKVEQIVAHLKGAATQQLTREGLHPLQAYRRADGSLPSPWSRRCWKVFLETRNDVERAIRYVEENPIKEGKRPQRWNLVTEPQW